MLQVQITITTKVTLKTNGSKFRLFLQLVFSLFVSLFFMFLCFYVFQFCPLFFSFCFSLWIDSHLIQVYSLCACMFFSIFLSYLYFPVLFPGIFFSISRLFFSVLDLLALLSTGEIIVVRSAPTAAAQFYFPQNESQVFSSNNSIFAKKLQIFFFGSVLFLKNTYDRQGVFLWSFFVEFE